MLAVCKDSRLIPDGGSHIEPSPSSDGHTLYIKGGGYDLRSGIGAGEAWSRPVTGQCLVNRVDALLGPACIEVVVVESCQKCRWKGQAKECGGDQQGDHSWFSGQVLFLAHNRSGSALFPPLKLPQCNGRHALAVVLGKTLLAGSFVSRLRELRAERQAVGLPLMLGVDIGDGPAECLMEFRQVATLYGRRQHVVHLDLGGEVPGRANAFKGDRNTGGHPGSDGPSEEFGEEEWRPTQDHNGNSVILNGFRAQHHSACARVPLRSQLGEEEPATIPAPAGLWSNLVDRAATTLDTVRTQRVRWLVQLRRSNGNELATRRAIAAPPIS